MGVNLDMLTKASFPKTIAFPLICQNVLELISTKLFTTVDLGNFFTKNN